MARGKGVNITAGFRVVKILYTNFYWFINVISYRKEKICKRAKKVS